MLPPNYSDICKPVNDLFSKDYPFGALKLEVKTTTANGVSFTVNGAQDIKSGAIISELKTKYADKVNGLTYTESWNTANLVTGQVEIANKFAKGLKLELSGSSALNSAKRALRTKINYQQDNLFARVNVDALNPAVTADVTISRDGALAGAELAYDLNSGAVTKTNSTLGFAGPDYMITMQGNNSLNMFQLAFYQRVTANVEAGARAVYDYKNPEGGVSAELATKYVLDKDAFVKAKVDNSGRMGLSFTQTLRPGVKLSLAGLFDTTRLQENAHKMGAALTFEA
ncbi:Mitochondrial porin [Coemansia sp. RSA 2523]|nr:Mitochondrial porin [Coemansia sp. RSA 1591]KAJ1777245.1 Mitochondrial porin [Coemansia sp. RSA 1824]KAJ1777342.1 Mitochondrial porin [Coemansia sp. RSA 2167]KAJ1784761.1 Mitochondrial porin [Coemansia sp. RSA 1938]KAJ1808729.1 Mitochondrial porin [Coemansia sp. RSA 2523]KAJ2143563.1 Mitochondrial porin [Coemansia sp. RSA 564]KAJ2147149.1 Mitochondrial porin [Coemansia sp. RSA 678]KAJ2164099.1 Mitochondrial porin [Coemansia sp. RSA 562]KAJ2186851.1 Mitochondrial porin [Coemansia sp. RSA 